MDDIRRIDLASEYRIDILFGDLHQHGAILLDPELPLVGSEFGGVLWGVHRSDFYGLGGRWGGLCVGGGYLAGGSYVAARGGDLVIKTTQ